MYWKWWNLLQIFISSPFMSSQLSSRVTGFLTYRVSFFYQSSRLPFSPSIRQSLFCIASVQKRTTGGGWWLLFLFLFRTESGSVIWEVERLRERPTRSPSLTQLAPDESRASRVSNSSPTRWAEGQSRQRRGRGRAKRTDVFRVCVANLFAGKTRPIPS